MAVSGHTSSDDFNDEDMADVLVELSRHDKPPDPVQTNHLEKSRTMPTDDDVFETPPTTPPLLHKAAVRLGIGFEQIADPRGAFPLKPVPSDINKKKRPYSDAQPMKPPPMRRISREKSNVRSNANSAVPTPPPESHGFISRSLDLSRSFDNISSVSSSMTNASPAWTSPNTSFCSESLATSFESTADDTDATVRPSFGQLRSRYPSDQSLWSIGKSKDNGQNRSNQLHGSAILSPEYLLHKSQEPVQSDIHACSTMNLDTTHMTKLSTNARGFTSTGTMTDLAKRLTSQLPFGISASISLIFSRIR